MSEDSEAEAIVRSLFTVKDVFDRGEGSKEYSIVYEDRSKAAFKSLYPRVKPLGFTPRLFGTKDDASLTLVKGEIAATASPRTPVFLSLLSIVAIIAAGWLLGDIYSQVEGGNALLIGASFVVGVVVVLVVKDLVQRFIVRRRGGVSTIPYYLPNIPFFIALPVLYFLPTFGAITFVRSPMVDRDALFDCYFFAPVAGVAVALAVALVGATTAISLTQAQYAAIFGGSGSLGTLSTNPSVLQSAAVSLSGYLNLSPSVPAGGVSLYSPLEVAGWIGLLLCFFSMLPAALFDGGRMATLALGVRGIPHHDDGDRVRPRRHRCPELLGRLPDDLPPGCDPALERDAGLSVGPLEFEEAPLPRGDGADAPVRAGSPELPHLSALGQQRLTCAGEDVELCSPARRIEYLLKRLR